MRPLVADTARLRLIAIAGILLLCLAYFYLIFNKKPLAPAPPVVSKCKDLGLGVKRMGGLDGFQFDAFVRDFTIIEGTQDIPPFAHGFALTPKKGVSALDISFGQRPIENMAEDPTLLLSDHVDERRVFDDQGHPIGDDYWGYLKSGERWRRVRLFKGGVVAKYGLVNEKDARLFDRVISTGCLLSP